MVNVLKFALAVTCIVGLAGCNFRERVKGGKRGGGALPESIDGRYLIHTMNYFGEREPGRHSC